MSLPNNYEILTVTSSSASIRVDIAWDYDALSELYVWQQDNVSGTVYYFSNSDFTVTENTDGTGDYILVSKVASATGSVTVNVARSTVRSQTYTLANSEPLDPVALIEALDKSMKINQEIGVTFAPDKQVITSVNPFEIPDKVDRAGKILAFDEDGNVNVTTSDEALDNAIDYAEEWAINPVDDPVSTSAGGNGIDTFSSLHWATKSSESATASANSATASANSATASANSATASANSATEAQGYANDANPVGTVYISISENAPTGTLELDGSTLNRNTYSALFAVIGDIYGGNGSTNFKLPDFRGRVLRHVDGTAGLDPDKSSRTDRGDGTTGNVIGTLQGDEIISHKHRLYSHDSGSDDYTNPPNANGNIGITGADAGSSVWKVANFIENTGGSETRMKNIYVKYYVKY